MITRKKTDNTNVETKLHLRRHFLRTYHAEGGTVLDACQGEGKLWGQLRQEFPALRYTGADMKPRAVGVMVDSRRLLAMRDWPWDIIDVDTYREPWGHWQNLCETVSRPVTVFLTIGLVRMAGGVVSNCCKRAAGLPDETPGCLAASVVDLIFNQLLWYPVRLGWQIENVLEATPRQRARYIGLRLVPSRPAPGQKAPAKARKPRPAPVPATSPTRKTP